MTENMDKKRKEQDANYFKINYVIPIETYLFFSYWHKCKNQVGNFSKKGIELYTNITSEEDCFFKNNIGGGHDFSAMKGNRDSNEMVFPIWVIVFLETLESNEESGFI